jgi:hypothetical protein
MPALCLPAAINLGLSVLLLPVAYFGLKLDSTAMFIDVIFIMISTFVLQALCSSGLRSVSWVLLLLPVILLAILGFYAGAFAIADAAKL